MAKIFKNSRAFGWLAVLLVLFVLLQPRGLAAQVGGYNYGHKTITVNGEATITAIPDVAYIPLDISTTAPIIDDAYNENQVKIENTLKKLKNLGIPKEWVRVLDPAPYKVEQYGAGENPIFGVSNIVVITIPNIDKIKSEELRKKLFTIAQAVSRTTVTPYTAVQSPGGALIQGELNKITYYGGQYTIAVFGLTDYEKLREQALLKAIEDAKTKASHLAKVFGVSLKEVIYIYQTVPYDGGCGVSCTTEEILPKGPKSIDAKVIKFYAAVNIIYSFE